MVDIHIVILNELLKVYQINHHYLRYFISNIVVKLIRRLARSTNDDKRQSRLFRYEPAGISIRAPCFIRISIIIK
jgi:hypothetical protein